MGAEFVGDGSRNAQAEAIGLLDRSDEVALDRGIALLGTVGILVAAILFRGGSDARPAPGPGGQPGVESNAGSRPESRTAAVPGDPREAGAAGDAARREVTAPAAAAASIMASARSSWPS